MTPDEYGAALGILVTTAWAGSRSHDVLVQLVEDWSNDCDESGVLDAEAVVAGVLQLGLIRPSPGRARRYTLDPSVQGRVAHLDPQAQHRALQNILDGATDLAGR